MKNRYCHFMNNISGDMEYDSFRTQLSFVYVAKAMKYELDMKHNTKLHQFNNIHREITYVNLIISKAILMFSRCEICTYFLDKNNFNYFLK